MPKQGKMVVKCDICGENMEVSVATYQSLESMTPEGITPTGRCRKNGCERLCGKKRIGTARKPEVLATMTVGSHIVDWPKDKRGARNGALAKLSVSPMSVLDCEASGRDD